MKNNKKKEDEVLKAIIAGYRAVVRERYDFKNLEEQYVLPDTIGDELVYQIRDYFLDFIYPAFERRQELNEAFNSLDDYIKNPKKLLQIVLDSSRLLLTHGVHLPRILSTGLKALNTFKAATNFENKLTEKAKERKISPPYKSKEINTLIQSISRNEIEDFIDSCKRLFGILHDRKLIKSLKEILSYLIKKMKEKEELYTSNEIRGLELGLEMLLKGDSFFNKLSKGDQEIIFDLIIQIERDALDDIYD